MTHIRSYKQSDFNTLRQWYIDYNVTAPQEGMLVEDGTFILELNNIPVLSQTVYLTQSKDVCYLECLIKNPEFKSLNLEPQLLEMRDFVCQYAKDRGYTAIFTYGQSEKLKDKYERIGFYKAMDNLAAFSRRL